VPEEPRRVSVITRPWQRLTLLGKILVPLLLVFLAVNIALIALWVSGLLPWLVQASLDTLGANVGILRFLAAATVILLITVPVAFLVIFFEMKIIAFVNLRIGPNRIGPWGTLSSVVHGLKVLAKEDFTPAGADVPVFTLAPAVVYLAAVMTLLVVPFAPGLYGFDMEIGLLYFFAVGGLGVIGLMMAGWSSFNKYSLLGGLRAAAGIISYELPLILGVVGIVLLAGSLNLNTIVENQSGSVLDWYIVRQPLGALIFFIAATAEGGRTPFDLTEADSEIVAGFATEYSGMRFGFFFFAEYVNVFVLSALTVVLFFGGWTAPIDVRQLGINFALPLDPGSLGILLLIGVAVVPPLVILAFALPIWMLRSDWSFLRALVIGFLLFNVVAMGLVGLWLAVSFEAVIGLIWFFAKTYAFVVTFVWMRGTLPRVRIDQLMGFAWKWLLPAALVNLFVTAGAIVIVEQLRRGGA
jgi:NADH-quinone oxidoreductase subunit H